MGVAIYLQESLTPVYLYYILLIPIENHQVMIVVIAILMSFQVI